MKPHDVLEALFWICAVWCLYVYLVYPLLLAAACFLVDLQRDWRRVLARHSPALAGDAPGLPAISMVIPVHNEAAELPAKLDNLRRLDYPPEKLQIVFVSDGSTDDSNRLLAEPGAPGQLEILPRARGKSGALNRGVELARHDLLVFCDAATLLEPDALGKLARHFQNPAVGVVCGALRFRGSAESQATEGLYWRYECLLRLLEGRLGATLTASGALYALRRECFRPLAADDLIDDFVIPMHARRLGFGVVFEPEAQAEDVAAPDVAGEFSRRVRLAVGSFRSLRQFLAVPLNVVTRWAFLSHKVARWLLPFVLLLCLAASLGLVRHPAYAAAFGLQLAFYLWALVGLGLRGRAWHWRSATFAYYLVAMNAAFLVGWLALVFRHGEIKWQRAA